MCFLILHNKIFSQIEIHEILVYEIYYLYIFLISDDRHFLPGYDSALFYGAYASYQYDREVSSRQYR